MSFYGILVAVSYQHLPMYLEIYYNYVFDNTINLVLTIIYLTILQIPILF